MIIGLWEKCTIGEIITGTYTRNIGEEYQNIKLMILAESNEQEWFKYRTENGLDIIPRETNKNPYWYRVTTD